MSTDLESESGEIAFVAPRYPVLLPSEMVHDVVNGKLSADALVTYAFVVDSHDGFDPEDEESDVGPDAPPPIVEQSRRDFAKARGISVRALVRHLGELEDAGWVAKNEKGVLVFLHARRLS